MTGGYEPSRNIHRRGYTQLGGFVDREAVRICLDERLVPLTPAELHIAIDHLDAQGLSTRQVAIRLGIASRTVTRRRAHRRNATAQPERH